MTLEAMRRRGIQRKQATSGVFPFPLTGGLHYDAAIGVTPTQWEDQAGLGYHLTKVDDPTFVASATPNGTPAFYYRGGNTTDSHFFEGPTPGLPDGTAARTVVLVAAFDASGCDPNTGFLWGGGGAGAMYGIGNLGGARWNIYGITSAFTLNSYVDRNDALFRVIIGTKGTAASNQMYIGNTAEAISNANAAFDTDNTQAAGGISIATQRDNGVHKFKGHIAEAIAIHGHVDQAAVDTINLWATAKHGALAG